MMPLPGQVLLWTWIAVIVLHFVTATETNWQDVGEDEIEKEFHLDGMIIIDRREFLNQYGRPRKQENTSHTEDETYNSVDDMLGKEISFYSRLKREERDFDGSGDGSTTEAESTTSREENTTETTSTTSPDGSHDSNTGDDVGMTVGLSVGIPVFFIAVGIFLFLCIWRRRRMQKSEDDSDDGNTYTPPVFAQILPNLNNSRNPWKKDSIPDASSLTLPTRNDFRSHPKGASRTDASSLTLPTHNDFRSHPKGTSRTDAFSITSFENDHAVYQGQSEFDQSLWGDSVKGFGKGDAAMSSNFSWDILLDQLSIGPDFSIKRPVISISPFGANQNIQASDFQA